MTAFDIFNSTLEKIIEDIVYKGERLLVFWPTPITLTVLRSIIEEVKPSYRKLKRGLIINDNKTEYTMSNRRGVDYHPLEVDTRE